jgi:hypothetical protein
MRHPADLTEVFMQPDLSLIFSPFDLRGTLLQERVVMAPTTRILAIPGTEAPQRLDAIAYAQPAGLDSHAVEDPAAGFFAFVDELSRLALAYVIEGATDGSRRAGTLNYRALRRRFDGPWLVNNGYSLEMAVADLACRYAVARFGIAPAAGSTHS